MAPLAQALEQHEQRRDEHYPHHGRHQHAAEHRSADDAAALGTRPGRQHHRQDADNERHGGHHYRAEAARCPLPCGIDNRHSIHAPGAGKLHDKNCVLGGEGYQ
ncbi:hypothetical protein ABW47_23330 [Enterobacter hormaechei]|nr:hypothetical protein ABW47_23330 [Enterobacter hormaechei]